MPQIVRLAGPTVARAASRRQMPDWLRDVLRRLAVIQSVSSASQGALP